MQRVFYYSGCSGSVTEIVLNIKGKVLKSHSKVPKIVYIKADKGEVKARDIICDETVEIINANHHINVNS